MVEIGPDDLFRTQSRTPPKTHSRACPPHDPKVSPLALDNVTVVCRIALSGLREQTPGRLAVFILVVIPVEHARWTELPQVPRVGLEHPDGSIHDGINYTFCRGVLRHPDHRAVFVDLL